MTTLPRLVALALAGGVLVACGDTTPAADDPSPGPSASRTPPATPAAAPTRLSIVDPTKGQTVRDAVTVTGSAPNAGDDVVCGLVTEGGIRASRGTSVVGEQEDQPFAWTVRVDLTDVVPGSYQLRCTTGGRQDGSEEALARYDSRDVIVAEPSTPPDPPAGNPDSPRPVFYVGDTVFGPRLFQSLVPNDTGEPDHGSGILVGHLMSTPPDPDYRTLWAPGSLVNLGSGIGDGRLALELSDAGIQSLEAMTAAEAALAVQQVAYSFGGEVAQLVDEEGREVRPVEKAPEVGVRSLVNLDSPAEGQVVRDRFVVRGLASSFEGTVGWEIRRPDGRTVLRGSAQAGGDLYRLSPFAQTIDVSLLRPGRYLYVAMTDDPSGEGRFYTDTRTLLIK